MWRKVIHSRAWLLALVFLGGVSIAAVLKPPVAHTPFVTMGHAQGFDLRIVLNEKNTLSQCQIARRAVRDTYATVCPECKLVDWGCIASAGPLLRQVQSTAPLDHYSLRFYGGDIVFTGSVPADQLEAACLASERQRAGRCYRPGELRVSMVKTASGFKAVSLNGVHLGAALMATFVIAAVVSFILVLTKPWHGPLSLDQLSGVQRFHEDPTPRIGGISIVAALWVSVLWLMPLDSINAAQIAVPTMIASTLAFLFGLAEDLTKSVGIAPRLMATMASAVLAWWLTGVSLTSVDIDGFDVLLSITVVSVMFSAFAVGGLANAINIIDGFHGLASGVVMITLLAISVVAYAVGDFPLLYFGLCVLVVTAGFFVVNYPYGKIFLGDGGAYLLGFLVGWLAILLPMRNPDVSPWASLLICAYPVTETVFTIFRRIKSKSLIANPDREHLHSLVKQGWVLQRFGHLSLNRRNALVAPPLWLFAAVPAAVAVVTFRSPFWCAVIFAGYSMSYWWIYRNLLGRLHEFQRHGHGAA